MFSPEFETLFCLSRSPGFPSVRVEEKWQRIPGKVR